MDGSTRNLRSQNIEILILEVDGVLTDGRAWPDVAGKWRRKFSFRDSIALRALQKSGVRVAILTRAASDDISMHASLIGVDECVTDCVDKASALRVLLGAHGIDPSSAAAVIESDEDAWMCDELGFVVAVCGAGPQALSKASLITKSEGGDGAVREACNALPDTSETRYPLAAAGER